MRGARSSSGGSSRVGEQLQARCGIAPSGSQIQPVIVGGDVRAVALAKAMQARGFDVRAVRPPTVPEGTSRLRVALTLNVDDEAVDAMVGSFGGRASEAGRMSQRFVIAGTDTDVGKTVFAAGLATALGAFYWKPVQAGVGVSGTMSGLAGFPPGGAGMTLCTTGTDAAEAVRLGVRADRVLPEVYRLTQPLSPHRAAEIDGVALDPARLVPPDVSPLVIELAGGLMVPLRRDLLQIDLVAQWKLPVVLVARTALGTINHTLLSLEALRAREIMVHGVAFVGEANEDNERTIVEMSGVRALGRLPLIEPRADTLADAFRESFRCGDFC